MNLRKKKNLRTPQYFLLTEGELLSLIVCLLLDISEYVVQISFLPVVGDLLDIVGVVACLLMFRLVGIVSLLEFVPGADIFPIFIATWVIWYFLKRRRGIEGISRKWI